MTCPNLKDVGNCPECGAIGHIVKIKRLTVVLGCPKCWNRWETLKLNKKK